MMYSKGLKLFYNKGLHLLVARPAVGMTQQQVQYFSIYNQEMVLTLLEILIVNLERVLLCKERQGRQKGWCRYIIRC
jgi:hypothetical protein